MIWGQSGRKSRSSRRKFLRKIDKFEAVELSCDAVPVAEVAEVVGVNRDVAWRGLLELAGGRGGLARRRDALDEPDAIPACLVLKE